MFNDTMDVGVRVLEQLVQPMNRLDVGIAAHLAEDGGAFDRLVTETVELPEKCGAFDFSHDGGALMFGAFLNPENARSNPQVVGGYRTRSSASRGSGFVFIQVVQPRRPDLPRAMSGTSLARNTSCTSQK